MNKVNKPGLAGNDGKAIKAPTSDNAALSFNAAITLDPGSATSPGRLRYKPGAKAAYQPVILSLGDGIVLRGQVYVPARLLAKAALDRAKANAERVEAERGETGTAPRRAEGSIGA